MINLCSKQNTKKVYNMIIIKKQTYMHLQSIKIQCSYWKQWGCWTCANNWWKKMSLHYQWEKAQEKRIYRIYFYIQYTFIVYIFCTAWILKNVQANSYMRRDNKNIPKCFGCVWVMKPKRIFTLKFSLEW